MPITLDLSVLTRVATLVDCMSQDNVWMAVAGLSADGRRLLDRSRLFSENHYYQTADHTTIHDIALHIAGKDTTGGQPWIDRSRCGARCQADGPWFLCPVCALSFLCVCLMYMCA